MDRNVYDALGVPYSSALGKSMRYTLDAIYEKFLREYTPLLRVNGKLQLEPRTSYITTRVGTLTGISLKVFGITGTQHQRLLRSENVPYNMSKAEQLRILRAMCDIVAVQEQADYKLIKAMRALPAHKEHLRPKKGKYG